MNTTPNIPVSLQGGAYGLDLELTRINRAGGEIKSASISPIESIIALAPVYYCARELERDIKE